MKNKALVIAAIVCLIFTFASDAQAMTVIDFNGVKTENCGLRIRHRQGIVRRAPPRIIISPVIIISRDIHYRRGYPPPPPPPPPPPRHRRY